MSQFDDMFDVWEQARQQDFADLKREDVAEAAAQKTLNQAVKSGQRFHKDLFEAIDGDTFKHRLTGRLYRLGGSEEGLSIDTFETMKRDPVTGEQYNPYERDPLRFKRHAKAYSKLFNYDEDKITPEYLVQMGEAQTLRLQERLDSLHGGRFDKDGETKDGREIIRFRDTISEYYL